MYAEAYRIQPAERQAENHPLGAMCLGMVCAVYVRNQFVGVESDVLRIAHELAVSSVIREVVWIPIVNEYGNYGLDFIALDQTIQKSRHLPLADIPMPVRHVNDRKVVHRKMPTRQIHPVLQIVPEYITRNDLIVGQRTRGPRRGLRGGGLRGREDAYERRESGGQSGRLNLGTHEIDENIQCDRNVAIRTPRKLVAGLTRSCRDRTAPVSSVGSGNHLGDFRPFEVGLGRIFLALIVQSRLT